MAPEEEAQEEAAQVLAWAEAPAAQQGQASAALERQTAQAAAMVRPQHKPRAARRMG
jgi:hypothetical protein